MSKAISNEIRQQVINERKTTKITFAELAKKYDVGLTTVKRWYYNPEPKQKKKLTDEQRAEVRELYKTDMSRNEIAKRFNVTPDAIGKICKDIVRPFNKKLTVEQKREIKLLAEKGIKQIDIASQYNVTPSYINQVINSTTKLIVPKSGSLGELRAIQRLDNKLRTFKIFKAGLTPGSKVDVIYTTSLHNKGRTQIEITSVTENVIFGRNQKGRMESFNWNSIFCGAVRLKKVS